MNTNEFKILLVEDDDALRFIVKDNLEQNNYNVKVAEDGKIAIDLFAKNDFDKSFFLGFIWNALPWTDK